MTPKPSPARSPNRLSPKATWIANKSVAVAHSDIVASPAFHAACSAALLQYQLQLLSPGSSTPEPMTAAALKLAGAQGFIGVLLSLSEPETSQPTAAPLGLQPPDERPFWSSGS